jgi:16S rRNA (cytosine967-C5)-methyltransferase
MRATATNPRIISDVKRARWLLESSPALAAVDQRFQHTRAFQRAAQILDVTGRYGLKHDRVSLPVNQRARASHYAKFIAQPAENRYTPILSDVDCVRLGCCLHLLELLHTYTACSLPRHTMVPCLGMPISQSRTIAFDVLRRVETQNAYADEALRAELGPGVRTEDAGLATELTLGVLRWRRLLDFLIDRNLTKATKTLDTEVRIALRLGVYQLWFLERVPAHAAVHESVELVKRARKRSAAPLVNAVLRKAAKEAAQFARSRSAFASFLPADLPIVEQMGILHSHPTWLVERWLRNVGEERTRALLETNNHVPDVSCYVLDAQRRDDVVSSLKKVGCVIEPGLLLRDAWRLRAGNPGATEAMQKGWAAIQDEASQTVAHLLAVEEGNSVLDLCAAPGGKTILLARAAGSEGHVIAADLHGHRVRAMAERFETAGVRNVELVTLDGTQPLPFKNRFDRILVDAPCSGTGTLARHPEIRWQLRAEDLTDLHARQVRLLKNALANLAPHGRLIYSTCSLEPEENEHAVSEALGGARGEFRVVTPRRALQQLLRDGVAVESLIDADGFFRTCSSAHGTDGFFAAAIEPTSKNF